MHNSSSTTGRYFRFFRTKYYYFRCLVFALFNKHLNFSNRLFTIGLKITTVKKRVTTEGEEGLEKEWFAGMCIFFHYIFLCRVSKL
jgi:hypothetical protein